MRGAPRIVKGDVGLFVTGTLWSKISDILLYRRCSHVRERTTVSMRMDSTDSKQPCNQRPDDICGDMVFLNVNTSVEKVMEPKADRNEPLLHLYDCKQSKNLKREHFRRERIGPTMMLLEKKLKIKCLLWIAQADFCREPQRS